MKIWFFSTVSEFQRLDKVPLSETIADVINWISYDIVSGMYPRHWANEYTVTWITTPLVSQVVSNSLLSGDLIDSLAYRAFKIIFDVRALYVSFGEGCTMAGVQRLEWCLVSSPIFQQGFQCFTFVKNKKRTRIHVHCSVILFISQSSHGFISLKDASLIQFLLFMFTKILKYICMFWSIMYY